MTRSPEQHQFAAISKSHLDNPALFTEIGDIGCVRLKVL